MNVDKLPRAAAEHKDNKAARNCIRSFGLFATSNSIMGLIADKEIKADKPRAGACCVARTESP